MKIETARFRLLNKSPFFGTILFHLPLVKDDKMPTLGVDGESLHYNPEFWDKQSDSDQLGLLCHEIAHLFLGHIWRKGHRNHLLWNVAGDYVITLMLEGLKDKGITLPKGCFIDKKYKGLSTEQVYSMIEKEVKKQKMSAGQVNDMASKSAVCDKGKWGKPKSGKGKQKSKQQEAKWKQVAEQAIERAKQKGDIPAGLERLFRELEPKEDWRYILMDFVQPFRNDYSFNPADRRFLTEDFILPDITDGQKIDWIAIAIDTSGSIDNPMLNKILGELQGILESYDKVKVKLTFCDTEATPFVELTEFDKSKIKPKGGQNPLRYNANLLSVLTP